MKARWYAVIGGGILFVSLSVSHAAIINSSFTLITPRTGGDPTLSPDSWSVLLSPNADRTLAMQTVEDFSGSSKALKVVARNTYTYGWDSLNEQNAWLCNQTGFSTISINQYQVVPDNSFISFKAAAFYEGAEVFAGASSNQPTMVVTATYTKNSGQLFAFNRIVPEGDWQILTIPLTDLKAGTKLTLSLFVTSRINSNEPHYPGLDSKEVIVTGYLDDFQFVPEPATLAVLGLGALGLLRRRRA